MTLLWVLLILKKISSPRVPKQTKAPPYLKHLKLCQINSPANAQDFPTLISTWQSCNGTKGGCKGDRIISAATKSMIRKIRLYRFNFININLVGLALNFVFCLIIVNEKKFTGHHIIITYIVKYIIIYS